MPRAVLHKDGTYFALPGISALTNRNGKFRKDNSLQAWKGNPFSKSTKPLGILKLRSSVKRVDRRKPVRDNVNRNSAHVGLHWSSELPAQMQHHHPGHPFHHGNFYPVYFPIENSEGTLSNSEQDNDWEMNFDPFQVEANFNDSP